MAGINEGTNLGRAVLHSGTVCAALTALHLGTPALAVSQALGSPRHLATAARLAAPLVAWFGALPAPTVLNLNVPNVAPVMSAPFARRRWRGLEWSRRPWPRGPLACSS